VNSISPSSGRKAADSIRRRRVPPFFAGPITVPIDDCSTRDGAEVLAKTIRTAWKLVGETVDVWVDEAVNLHNGSFSFTIQSDLVNGLPRNGRVLAFGKRGGK
jgi:hypothetical protein